MSSSSSRPALFLDRDGVINVDRGYVYRIADFEWIEGAIDTIAAFNARGWWVFIVTNQSGIARGYYTEEDMTALHAWMGDQLAAVGAHIDRIYHCPFHEDGTIERYRRDSYDRKPRPGMLIRAMTDFPVIREQSFLIGDKDADMEAARAAGVRGFQFSGGDLRQFSDWALADLGESR
jgi:D-glycero-D-manno-heptose 1,7-bisphosphate phosphatase